MKILSRYILLEIFTFFGVSLFAFTAILLTLRMLHFAALIVDKGVAFNQIAQIFIAIIPTFMEIAIPLSTLLGVMLAIARFSGDSEIIVMRSSGISLYRILRPVLMFGVLASSVGLMVSQEFKPWGYRLLGQTFYEIARTKSTSGLDEGIFNKLGPLTLYAEVIDDRTGGLSRVIVDDRRDQDSRKVVVAKTGVIISDDQNRQIIIQLQDGDIHEIDRGKYLLTHFAANTLAMDSDEIFESDDKKHGKQLGELTLPELEETRRYFAALLPQFPDKSTQLAVESLPTPLPPGFGASQPATRDSAAKRLLRVRLETGQRFSLPFASLALALLGLPLGIQPPRTQRTWGAGLAASLGMCVFVFYYGLFSIGLVFAQSGAIHPYVALWLPNVCVFFVALWLIRNMASDRWQSVSHAIEVLIRAPAAKFFRARAPA